MFLAIPIAFAFSAGVVAAFNPCGVVMLPAYIGYKLGAVSETDNPLKAVMQGIGVLVTCRNSSNCNGRLHS